MCNGVISEMGHRLVNPEVRMIRFFGQDRSYRIANNQGHQHLGVFSYNVGKRSLRARYHQKLLFKTFVPSTRQYSLFMLRHQYNKETLCSKGSVGLASKLRYQPFRI